MWIYLVETQRDGDAAPQTLPFDNPTNAAAYIDHWIEEEFAAEIECNPDLDPPQAVIEVFNGDVITRQATLFKGAPNNKSIIETSLKMDFPPLLRDALVIENGSFIVRVHKARLNNENTHPVSA